MAPTELFLFDLVRLRLSHLPTRKRALVWCTFGWTILMSSPHCAALLLLKGMFSSGNRLRMPGSDDVGNNHSGGGGDDHTPGSPPKNVNPYHVAHYAVFHFLCPLFSPLPRLVLMLMLLVPAPLVVKAFLPPEEG